MLGRVTQGQAHGIWRLKLAGRVGRGRRAEAAGAGWRCEQKLRGPWVEPED